jgi:integrase
MEGDRTYPLWAFLLGSGLRIGELVWLRWPNVDLRRRRVHVVDFVSTLGHDLQPSHGKSRDAVRSIELDDGLISLLRLQRTAQAKEALASADYLMSDFMFTKQTGGSYHPQYLSRLIARYSEEPHGLRHQRDARARQWSAAQGRRRTAGACGSQPVHEPLQSRHPNDAARLQRRSARSCSTVDGKPTPPLPGPLSA